MYAWDISHAFITTYHPYCHSPSALTEYLKQRLRIQRARRLGRSPPAQVELNVQPEHNTFPAHYILEILGEIVDHGVPDPFVGVSSAVVDVAIQLGGNFLDPKVHFGSPQVPEEQHGLGHQVIHDPSLFVDSMVYALAGHEFLHFVSVAHENFWLFADHLVQ